MQSSGLASSKAHTPITGFSIGQESYRQNGVLISQPRRIDEQIRFLIETNQITTLEGFSSWLEENIEYRRDLDGDHWASPEETLARKYGDCEDFAFLVSSTLKILGYTPKVVVLRRRAQDAHAICLFQVDGYYFWFDNATLKKTSTRSLEAFVKQMVGQYALIAMLELNPENREWSVLYRKS